jgi:hypothetical protein
MFDPGSLRAEWGVPSLFSRSPDGVIFPALAAEPSATRDRIRAAVDQAVDIVESTGEAVGIGVVRATGPRGGTVEVQLRAGTVRGRLTGIEELDL